MDKERISELFQLLLERIRNEETTDSIHKTLRECNKNKGHCCNACDKCYSCDCETLNAMQRNVRQGQDIDTRIASFIQCHGVEFARLLGASRVQCKEWLIAKNNAIKKITGENGYYNEQFAKEIGVKL